MPGIPMSAVEAAKMADDWLALRSLWDEVAEADRVPALEFFQLSEADLMNFSREELVSAYTAPQWLPTDAVFYANISEGLYYSNGLTHNSWGEFLLGLSGSFARATTGTYNNAAGLMSTAAIDELRFNYPGPTILIEPELMNIAKLSQVLNDPGWGSQGILGITPDTLVAPDGTMTADVAIPNSDNASHDFFNLPGLTTTSDVWSLSAYFKAAGYEYGFLQFAPNNGADRYSVIVDLTNGAVTDVATAGSPTGTSVEVVDAGNGWFRVCVTATCLEIAVNTYAVFGGSNLGTPVYNVSAEPVFIGDEISGTSIWGVQVANTLGSYIPTGSDSVIRTADELTFTLPPDVTRIVYTFDDDSVQTLDVSPGIYAVPTDLNRPNISKITGFR